jgi:hypothetical protein
MRDCSRRGSIILDAFADSGSTIKAAEQIGAAPSASKSIRNMWMSPSGVGSGSVRPSGYLVDGI